MAEVSKIGRYRRSCCDTWMAERIHWWTVRWLELRFLEWLQWLQWLPYPQLLDVVGWRRIERRLLLCVFLFFLYFLSRALVGWGGINVLFRVRGTRSFLTRSWCGGVGWGISVLFRVRGTRSFLIHFWYDALRFSLGTSDTLWMLRSVLFPSNFWRALDVTLCTFP